MKLYAYCIAGEPYSPAGFPAAIEGALVRSLQKEEMVALVSEFNGDAVAVNRTNIVTHEGVVRRVLEETTPLPFRFGTLVTPAKLESYLSSQRDFLKAKLRTVRGRVEMSVKIIWKLPKPSDMNGSAKIERRDDPQSGGEGAAFLLAKRRDVLGDERLLKQANDIRDWLKSRLKDFVYDERVTLRPSDKLVLAASYLIERIEVSAYGEALRMAMYERPDLHFLSSGPWAPYSFANIDLEFKSQFGVS